jgi:hypothetical protein
LHAAFPPVLFLSEVGMTVPYEELRDALLDDPMKVLAIAGTRWPVESASGCLPPLGAHLGRLNTVRR